MKEILKKNLFSLICGVVALVAVGAIFYPIDGEYAKLKAELDGRQAVLTNLKTLINKQHNTPLVPGMAKAGKLDQFPTKPVIEAWTAVTKQIELESEQMFDAVKQMNKRELLVPNSLPAPVSTFVASTFRREYQSQMKMTDDEARKNAMPTKILKAGYVPSSAAVAERRERLTAELLANTQRDPITQMPLDKNFEEGKNKALLAVPDILNQEVAERSLIYVDYGALDPLASMMDGGGGQAPEATQIYIAQLGYWIQKDVLQSIANANKDSKSVKESPVKHLFKFKFSSNALSQLSSGSPPQDAASQSRDAAGDWKLNYSASPTGRATNGVYDVYQFGLRLFVDADKITPVIRELTRGKLINVVKCEVASRDTADYQFKGYFYGPNPIVQLDLQCEALMLRDWTEKVMPNAVKTALGVPAAAKAN